MEKVIYTIGEVAEALGESVSAVRFWTNSFSKFLKPKRNAKGNRLYAPEDIETLKQIKMLVKEGGMTLEGASKRMSAERNAVKKKARVLDSLKSIRASLLEVRKSL